MARRYCRRAINRPASSSWAGELDSINVIEDHVRDMTYERFAQDRKTVDAVIRNLTVIFPITIPIRPLRNI